MERKNFRNDERFWRKCMAYIQFEIYLKEEPLWIRFKFTTLYFNEHTSKKFHKKSVVTIHLFLYTFK
jgi:hypothetical protein